MMASQQDALQTLTTFTVTGDYHRHETALDIWLPGHSEPTARLYKDGPVGSRGRFQALTGPRLDQPAGQVAGSGAWAADGTQVGTVGSWANRLERTLQNRWLILVPVYGLQFMRWRAEQNGGPVLIGRPAGLATRLRFNSFSENFVQMEMIFPNIVDHFVSFRFRFDAAGGAGFEISRRARQPHITVTVNDPRVNRLLVLACVLAINARYHPSVRRAMVSLTTNPYKR